MPLCAARFGLQENRPRCASTQPRRTAERQTSYPPFKRRHSRNGNLTVWFTRVHGNPPGPRWAGHAELKYCGYARHRPARPRLSYSRRAQSLRSQTCTPLHDRINEHGSNLQGSDPCIATGRCDADDHFCWLDTYGSNLPAPQGHCEPHPCALPCAVHHDQGTLIISKGPSLQVG